MKKSSRSSTLSDETRVVTDFSALLSIAIPTSWYILILQYPKTFHAAANLKLMAFILKILSGDFGTPVYKATMDRRGKRNIAKF